MWHVDNTIGEKQMTIFTIHGPCMKWYMIKSSLRSLSTIQLKIFLSNQVNFPIGQKCFLRKLKMGHISLHIVTCWYKLYVSPAILLFNDIFSVFKVRWMKISVSMVTQWTRGRGNKYRTEKEDEHFGRFKLFLHREINTVHEFSCKQNSVCAVVTMHKFSCMQTTLFMRS